MHPRVSEQIMDGTFSFPDYLEECVSNAGEGVLSRDDVLRLLAEEILHDLAVWNV